MEEVEVELVRWNALAERWYHSRNEFIHPVPTSSTHGGAVAAAADRTAPLRNYAETLYSEAALLPDLSAFLLRLSARLRSASAVAAQLTISGVRVPGFLVCLAHLPQLRADSCAVRALVACVVPFFTPPAATDARAARLRRRAQSWASETLKSFFRTGADIEASLVAIHDSADSGMVEQQQQQQRRRLREALPVERMLAQVGKLTGTSYDDEGVLAGLQAAEGATVLAEVLRLLDEQAPSATAPVAAATTPDSEALAAAVRLVSSLLVALLPTPPGREEVPGAAVGAAPLVGTVADGTCAEEQGREARWALILPVAERLLLLRSPPPGAETAGNCEWLCSTFVDAMLGRRRRWQQERQQPQHQHQHQQSSPLCARLSVPARTRLWLLTPAIWEWQLATWMSELWRRPFLQADGLLRLLSNDPHHPHQRQQQQTHTCHDPLLYQRACGVLGALLRVTGDSLALRLLGWVHERMAPPPVSHEDLSCSGSGGGSGYAAGPATAVQQRVLCALENAAAACQSRTKIEFNRAAAVAWAQSAVARLNAAIAAATTATAVGSASADSGHLWNLVMGTGGVSVLSYALRALHLCPAMEAGAQDSGDSWGEDEVPNTPSLQTGQVMTGADAELRTLIVWLILCCSGIGSGSGTHAVAVEATAQLDGWLSQVVIALRGVDETRVLPDGDGCGRGIGDALRSWLGRSDGHALLSQHAELGPRLLLAWLRGSRWRWASTRLLEEVVNAALGDATAVEKAATMRALLVTEALEDWAQELDACIRCGASAVLQKKIGALLPCLTAQVERTARWLRTSGGISSGASALDMDARVRKFQASVAATLNLLGGTRTS